MQITDTQTGDGTALRWPGRMQLSRTPGSLQIDSRQARRECGYFSLREFSAEIARISLEQAARGIVDIVAAGEALAAIHAGGNAIAGLARQRGLVSLQDNSYGLAFMPLSPPAIRYTPGSLLIDVVY